MSTGHVIMSTTGHISGIEYWMKIVKEYTGEDVALVYDGERDRWKAVVGASYDSAFEIGTNTGKNSSGYQFTPEEAVIALYYLNKDE